jgi:hypothetical protein
MKEVYTPLELSARWNCSARSVRAEIYCGRLKCFRVGRLFRILDTQVYEYETKSPSCGPFRPPTDTRKCLRTDGLPRQSEA